MAIQFSCVSCGQLIEIDDEWALRLVECPYCHDTVTAPSASSVRSGGEGSSAQWATPSSAVEDGAGVAVEVAEPQNKMAIVALVLGGAAMGLLVWMMVEVQRALVGRVGPETTMPEFIEIYEEAIAAGEPWVQRLAWGSMGWFALWLSSLVCSIVAVARPGRRAMAVCALLLALAPASLFVLGMIAGGEGWGWQY
jgi:hypothetical protein